MYTSSLIVPRIIGSVCVFYGPGHPLNRTEIFYPHSDGYMPPGSVVQPRTGIISRRALLHGLLSALVSTKDIYRIGRASTCLHINTSSNYLDILWNEWLPDWEVNGWPRQEPSEDVDRSEVASLASSRMSVNKPMPDSDFGSVRRGSGASGRQRRASKAPSIAASVVSNQSESGLIFDKTSGTLVNEDLLRKVAVYRRNFFNNSSTDENAGMVTVRLISYRDNNADRQAKEAVRAASFDLTTQVKPAIDTRQRRGSVASTSSRKSTLSRDDAEKFSSFSSMSRGPSAQSNTGSAKRTKNRMKSPTVEESTSPDVILEEPVAATVPKRERKSSAKKRNTIAAAGAGAGAAGLAAAFVPPKSSIVSSSEEEKAPVPKSPPKRTPKSAARRPSAPDVEPVKPSQPPLAAKEAIKPEAAVVAPQRQLQPEPAAVADPVAAPAPAQVVAVKPAKKEALSTESPPVRPRALSRLSARSGRSGYATDTDAEVFDDARSGFGGDEHDDAKNVESVQGGALPDAEQGRGIPDADREKEPVEQPSLLARMAGGAAAAVGYGGGAAAAPQTSVDHVDDGKEKSLAPQQNGKGGRTRESFEKEISEAFEGIGSDKENPESRPKTVKRQSSKPLSTGRSTPLEKKQPVHPFEREKTVKKTSRSRDRVPQVASARKNAAEEQGRTVDPPIAEARSRQSTRPAGRTHTSQRAVREVPEPTPTAATEQPQLTKSRSRFFSLGRRSKASDNAVKGTSSQNSTANGRAAPESRTAAPVGRAPDRFVDYRAPDQSRIRNFSRQKQQQESGESSGHDAFLAAEDEHMSSSPVSTQFMGRGKADAAPPVEAKKRFGFFGRKKGKKGAAAAA